MINAMSYINYDLSSLSKALNFNEKYNVYPPYVEHVKYEIIWCFNTLINIQLWLFL